MRPKITNTYYIENPPQMAPDSSELLETLGAWDASPVDDRVCVVCVQVAESGAVRGFQVQVVSNRQGASLTYSSVGAGESANAWEAICSINARWLVSSAAPIPAARYASSLDISSRAAS